MRSAVTRRFSLLLVFLLLLAIAACSRGDSSETASAGADSTAVETAEVAGADSGDESTDGDDEEVAVPVEITVVGTGPIESLIRSTATLEAESQVIVIAEAARHIVQMMVEEGDRVEAGQTLLRLQDDEQNSALAKSRTLFEQAEREWQRQERLQEKGLTTERDYNDALAVLEQRRLDVNDAERELGYTRVRAPIGGTVTQRFVKIGAQVNPGTELFEIIDFDSLVARVYVPERELRRLAKGLDARVFAPAVRDGAFIASVDRVAPVIDSRTGTVKVTLDVGGQPGLRPGLYVDVELITAIEPDAVLVPKRSLLYENDRIFAFRIRGTTAERVAIVPVMDNREFVRPAGSIAVGDSVVVAGQAGLKSGAEVDIVTRTVSAEQGS